MNLNALTITMNSIPSGMTSLGDNEDIELLFTQMIPSQELREFFIWISQKRYFWKASNDFIVIASVFEQHDKKKFQSEYEIEKFVQKHLNSNYVDLSLLTNITSKFIFDHEPIHLLPSHKKEKFMNFIPSFHYVKESGECSFAFAMPHQRYIGGGLFMDSFKTALDLFINLRSHEISRVIAKTEEKFASFFTDLYMIEDLLRKNKTNLFIEELFDESYINGLDFMYDVTDLSYRERALLVFSAMSNLRKNSPDKSLLTTFGLKEQDLQKYLEKEKIPDIECVNKTKEYRDCKFNNENDFKVLLKSKQRIIDGNCVVNREKRQYRDLMLTIDFSDGDKETIRSQYGSCISLIYYLNKKHSAN